MKNKFTINAQEVEEIELYLQQQLNEEQQKAFTQKLATDAAWQEKVQEVKQLLLAVEEATLKQKINELHTNFSNRQRQDENTALIRPLLSSQRNRWLAAAAVLLLLVTSVFVFLLRPTEDEQLYSSYYKADPGLITSMGISDNYVFQKAMVDYKNGQYQQAIEAWQSLEQSSKGNDTLLYFLGSAHLANGDLTQAIGYFSFTINNEQSAFYKDACWFAGLSYLKSGDHKKAISLLEKSGHPQSNQLINRLNKK
jgi:Tetratricopeptide repeat